MDIRSESFIHPVEDASDPVWSLAPVKTATAVEPFPEELDAPEPLDQEPDQYDGPVARSVSRAELRSKHRRKSPPGMAQKLTADGFPSGVELVSTRDQVIITRLDLGDKVNIGGTDPTIPPGAFRVVPAKPRERVSLNWTGRPLDGGPTKAKDQGSINWVRRPLDATPAKPRNRTAQTRTNRSLGSKQVRATRTTQPAEASGLPDPVELSQRAFLDAKPKHVALAWDDTGAPYLRAANGDELHVTASFADDSPGKPKLDGFTLVQRPWWGEAETVESRRGDTEPVSRLVREFIDQHQDPLRDAIADWVGPKLVAAHEDGEPKAFAATRVELVQASVRWRERIVQQLGDDGWPPSANRVFDEAYTVLDLWLTNVMAAATANAN
jgi:hypothetical protein